jgi:hypothetical protein
VTRDFPSTNPGVFIVNDTIVRCGERDSRCHGPSTHGMVLWVECRARSAC